MPRWACRSPGWHNDPLCNSTAFEEADFGSSQILSTRSNLPIHSGIAMAKNCQACCAMRCALILLDGVAEGRRNHRAC